MLTTMRLSGRALLAVALAVALGSCGVDDRHTTLVAGGPSWHPSATATPLVGQAAPLDPAELAMAAPSPPVPVTLAPAPRPARRRVASSTRATTSHASRGAPRHRATSGGNGRCGGDLPPCWVLDRESGYNDGDPNTYNVHARNAGGCGGRGCDGKWQCDPRSCNGTGTEAEQDASAAALWDHGNGCSHWNAC